MAYEADLIWLITSVVNFKVCDTKAHIFDNQTGNFKQITLNIEESNDDKAETSDAEEDIKKALERDNFMTPNEAKKFGLIDEVVEKRS